jgi:outer membrane lipoprotein-sorting protein
LYFAGLIQKQNLHYKNIMKNFKLLLVAFALTAFAQVNAQTAEEIVANYFENTGGVDNWKKIKGIKFVATVNQMGMEIPIEMVQLGDGRMATTITFQGKEIKQGVFDGETLWNTNFMSMKAEKSDPEQTAMVKQATVEFPDPFLNYKDNGFTIALDGEETIDGAETFKIKLTKKPVMVDGKEEENIVYYFFDKDNFVPIATRSEVKAGPSKGMMSENTFSDYQEVEGTGIYFPFSQTMGANLAPGGQAPAITFKSVEINPTVDDSIFAFPKEDATPTTKN